MKGQSIHWVDKPLGMLITENQNQLIRVHVDLKKGIFVDYALSRKADLKYLCAVTKEHLAPNTHNETVFKN